jgi:hypothetical protein
MPLPLCGPVQQEGHIQHLGAPQQQQRSHTTEGVPAMSLIAGLPPKAPLVGLQQAA